MFVVPLVNKIDIPACLLSHWSARFVSHRQVSQVCCSIGHWSALHLSISLSVLSRGAIIWENTSLVLSDRDGHIMVWTIFHFLPITLKFQLTILSKFNIAICQFQLLMGHFSVEWDYGPWPHPIPITELCCSIGLHDLNRSIRSAVPLVSWIYIPVSDYQFCCSIGQCQQALDPSIWLPFLLFQWSSSFISHYLTTSSAIWLVSKLYIPLSDYQFCSSNGEQALYTIIWLPVLQFHWAASYIPLSDYQFVLQFHWAASFISHYLTISSIGQQALYHNCPASGLQFHWSTSFTAPGLTLKPVVKLVSSWWHSGSGLLFDWAQ